MKKIKKLILITFLILLIAIISIGTFAGNLLYNIAIDSNFSKNTIYAEYVYKDTYSDKTWLLQRSNYTDEYINSFDNFWYIEISYQFTLSLNSRMNDSDNFWHSEILFQFTLS